MNITRVFWFAFKLLVFTVPLSQYLSSRLLVIVLLLSFFVKEYKLSNHLKNSWDFLLYVAVLAAGLIYTENIQLGVKVIETNLSFIAIPIILASIPNVDEIKSKEIYYAFASGLLVSCCICLGFATINYFSTGNIQSFFYYNLTDTILLQPTYFAYYLIFAITYGLYLLYYQKTTEHIIGKSGVVLFFFFVLMLTGGQTAFISMLLIFAFFILKFLIEEKGYIKKITTGLIAFMILGMFLTTVVVKDYRSGQLNDSWDRLVLWESAIKAIPSPLLGVGTGDYKSVLNQYYSDHGMVKFARESYNSHNQFIQILFSNGILGVMVLMIMMARPLYLSFKNENILGILALFPFLVYSITEVFLGRYQGVIFFALLHQFFIVQVKSKKIFEQ